MQWAFTLSPSVTVGPGLRADTRRPFHTVSTAWTFDWVHPLTAQGPSEGFDVLTASDSVVRPSLSRRATYICRSRSGKNRRSANRRPHRAARRCCDGIVDSGFELISCPVNEEHVVRNRCSDPSAFPSTPCERVLIQASADQAGWETISVL